jgi:hypothetical protein
MSAPDEKPDVRELVGSAVNSSSLVMRPRGEGALDRVAALGAATLNAGLPGELGAVLWHLRFGRHQQQLGRASSLFTDWMMERPQFAEIEPDVARRLLLQMFAPLALHEWLSDRCSTCGGSGKMERTRDGAVIRPRGSMQRNARFAPCRACGGNGRARPNHKLRARALGVPIKWYFDQRWPARFMMADHWLTHALSGRLIDPLTRQLERRKRPA